MNWYVLCVKKGKEKKVSEALEGKDLEVYCPTCQEIRQWSDRKKKVETALFPSYVFVKLDDKNRNTVFDTPFIYKYLFWLGKPAIIQQKEIDIIDQWINGYYKVDYAPNKGDKIVVQSGPFKGQKAIIEEIGQKRLKLLLYKLGLHVSTNPNMVLAS